MKRYILIILILLSPLTVFLQADNLTSPLISIVPRPTQIVPGSGNFTFSAKTAFAVENQEQAVIARNFIDLFTRAAGITPALNVGGKEGQIRFVTDSSFKPEAYLLEITPQQILIKASDTKGFFYALQSIRQLLPAAIESEQPVQNIAWSVPAMTVQDEPRFGFRGLLLDPVRCFIPKENVLRIIDCMAMLKINKLHFHLTDDNGWRIEIKKYPRLTEVGAWRVDRTDVPFHSRRNPERGELTPIGGFYTQEEIREIVAYAADRQIEVIPEIDVPAHSNAALAAYPQFACPVVKDFIGVLPGLGGRNSEIIYCAGNDSVFTFLRKKGREVIGWDELTNSSFLPEESIILGWQGMGTAALKAAEKGHRFIMTPARIMYLIRYQGPQWFEPVTYFGNNTLKDVFDYEPVQKDWKPEYESLLMGIQACMWTEFCNKPEDVDYLLFPRLAALAEVAWTAAGTKDWTGFLKRMDVYNSHIAEKGIVYARSMYNIQQTVTPVDGHLEVSLECIRPDVEIYYTLNGSNPAMSSHRYDGPICVTKTQMVKAATFMNGKQMGETLELPLTWNKATAKPLLDNKKNEMLLVNGLRGSLKYTDFEWCNWSRNDSISFTIDLQSQEKLNKLTIGCITNYGMGAHKPKMIRVEVSDDNRTYHAIGELNFSPEEIYQEGTFRNDYSIDMGGVSARYVRVTAEGAGICPDEHVRPGQEARVYFDEVIIE